MQGAGKNTYLGFFLLRFISLFSARHQLLKCWGSLSRFQLTLLLPTLHSPSHRPLKRVSHSRSLPRRSLHPHLRPSVKHLCLRPAACPRKGQVKMSGEI